MMTLEESFAAKEEFNSWNGKSDIIDLGGANAATCGITHWITVSFYPKYKLFTCRYGFN